MGTASLNGLTLSLKMGLPNGLSGLEEERLKALKYSPYLRPLQSLLCSLQKRGNETGEMIA